MSTIILLFRIPPQYIGGVGAVIAVTKAHAEVLNFCEDNYGIPDQDWKVEIDPSQGVVVLFKDANMAMRFKLAWPHF